jgi:hypothetical protein
MIVKNRKFIISLKLESYLPFLKLRIKCFLARIAKICLEKVLIFNLEQLNVIFINIFWGELLK